MPTVMPMKKSEALAKLDDAMRLENKSIETRKQYKYWAETYCTFIERSTIKDLPSKQKFDEFILRMVRRNPQPSLSNQKQAFFAILYFYKNVLGLKMEGLKPPSGHRSQKIFNVLTRSQIQTLIDALPREYQLIAKLLYGTGIRIDECLSLRIKDIDFDHASIYVQEGKGDKARAVDLPDVLIKDLKSQVEQARSLYEFDKNNKQGGVYLPHGYGAKHPKAAHSFEWFWLFPNPNHGLDPDSGKRQRHHVYIFSIQKAFKAAREKTKLPIYTTPHILRHCYATHYLERVLKDLPPIPNIGKFARDLLQEKMGHVSAETTDIYIHLAMPKHTTIDHSPLTELLSAKSRSNT